MTNHAKFINYDAQSDQLYIATYRTPSGYYNEDVMGLIDDIIAERSGCCPIDGVKDALEDGSIWQGLSATIELLERMHNLITGKAASAHYL